MADPNAPASPDPFAHFDVAPPPQAIPQPQPSEQPAAAQPVVANDNAPVGEPDVEGAADPFAHFDVGPAPTSATGAFARGAEKAVLPAGGSLAGAGAGAEVGAAIGTFIAPGVGTTIGGVLGGIAGGIAGSHYAQQLQDWGVRKLSPGWRDALGFNPQEAEQDEKQHGAASFGGGLVPYLVTMHPSLEFRGAAGATSKILPEAATALQRLLAHPATAKVFGGGLMGGMEIGNEELSDEKIQWPKVAVATVFGTIFNRPNGIGEAITELGAHPTRTVLGRPHPTLAQAADLKVLGPGVTESVFQGTQEQAPQAAMTAQENARVEQSALGEPPEPDLHAVARQMEPELFGKYDDLLKRREIFAEHEVDGQTIPALSAHLAATNAEIETLGPEVAAAYRRAADTTGTGSVEPEKFGSFAEMLAAREKETGGEVSRETVPPAPANEGMTFTTAKGSTYQVHEDGTTTRNKAARPDAGHEGDFGPKPKTDKTIYVDPKVASELSGAGLSGLGPKGFRVAIRDGKAYGLTWNEKANNWGASPGARDIPFTTEPEVGKSPVELWKPANDVPGHEAYRGQHAGNAITEVNGTKAPNEPASSAAPVPSAPQRTIGEQRAAIASDVSKKLIAAGRPEEEAREWGQVEAARYVTRAGWFNGKLGTPEELYAREGSAIAGPKGRPQVPAGAQPEPVKPRRAAGRAAANPQTWSLYEFLAHEGGLKPTADLRSILGGKNPFIPGFGPLLREGGLSMDEALTRAKEQRYIIDPGEVDGRENTISVNHLQDMIDNESRGQKNYVIGHEPVAKTLDPNTRAKDILDELHHEVEATGGKVDPALERRVVEIMVKEGETDVHSAYERAIMEDHDNHEALLNERRGTHGEVEGYDHEGGPASGVGAEHPGEGGQTGLPGEEAGQGHGGEPRDHGEADRQALELAQAANASVKLNPKNIPGRDYIGASDTNPIVRMFKTANASSIVHETGHKYLAELMRDSLHPDAPEQLKADAKATLDWLGAKSADDITTRHHEKFARGFEQYLREGVAPSKELAGVFAKFRNWLLSIYQSIKGLGTEISPDIRSVFDRMLEMEPQRTIITPHERPVGGPLLHEIHTADAAHTEPHEAAAVFDRTKAEFDRYVAEPPKDVALEVAPALEKAEAEQAARTGAEPGAEAAGGPGPAPEVVPGGGGSGSVPASGGVGERGGELGGSAGQPATEGDGVSRPDHRAKLGEHPGTALAPGPSDLFGPTDSGLIDKAGNIVLKNLNSPEEILQAFRESAGRNNDFIGDRRGVVTPGQVMDLARALGREGAEDIVNKWVVGQALNAEQIRAVQMLAKESAAAVHATWQKASTTGAVEDVIAQCQAEARQDMIQAVLSGATAEWGRAGGAFKRLRGDPAGMTGAQIIQAATGKTLFQKLQLAKLGAEMKTPEQAAKLMLDAKKTNFASLVLEYWINGLISGPATHLTYMVGNTISAIMKVPESLVSAGVSQVASALGREGTGVHAGEAGALIRGGLRGIAPAIKASIEAARTGITTELPGEGEAQAPLPFQPGAELGQGAKFDEHASFHDVMSSAYGLVQGMKDTVVSTAALLSAGGVKGEPTFSRVYSPNRATPNIAFRGVTVLPTGDIATLPSRGVAVIHSFFRSLVFSMEKNAMAYRQAANEGLAGTELHARVAELRQDPSQDMMNQAAAHEATETALMGKGSELTQRLAALTNTRIFGAPLLKFIDPFVRVSGNIIDQSLIRRTPVGLLTMLGPETELARDLTGKNGNVAQDKAIGRMMMGTALAVTFGSLAAQKMLSGSGPKDPKEANIWRMAGNQAHSVRVGDTWYQVNKLGPVGMLASLSADLYDVAHEAEEGDFTKAGAHLLHAITQNVLDESAMHGPAELLKAIETPDRYGESYIRNYLAAFVPYSVGLGQIARGADPWQRDTKTLIDTIRNKIPGHLDSYFGHELPVRRDIWGEPLPSRTALGGAGISAIYEQSINNDPVNQAMYKVGVFPGAVERKIHNVDLTPDQYDDFQRLSGRMAKMRLDKMVLSPQFRQQTPSVQHDWMTEVIKQSRESARQMVMIKNPQIIRQSLEAKQVKKQAINNRDVE